MEDSKSGEFVTALARGLSVILAFDKDHRELTLTEVAERAQLARATSRRLLMTLEALGYVRSDGKRFGLTVKVLDLGTAYLASLPLAEAARPIMKRVAEALDESCSLSVLDGQDIVYLARVPPRHMMTIPVNVGTRLPAFVTSTGRVLLAAMPPPELESYLASANFRTFTRFTVTPQKFRTLLRQVTAQGYALTDQELEESLRALAVPVRDRNGTVVAGLNVSAHAMRATKRDMLQKFLPVLRQAAGEIGGLV